MTQPSQPLPLASSGWTDERRRGSDSSRGQLTHHIGTDTGKGSTWWWVTGWGGWAHFMYVCECTLPLDFDRGAIIPFPVTPEECRVRFLLGESCPLTCHHHTDTISSFLRRGIPHSVCFYSGRKLQSLYKPCCSGNWMTGWFNKAMLLFSLHAICFCSFEGQESNPAPK